MSYNLSIGTRAMSLSILCVCLCADSCMGPEKHEVVPAGSSVLTQSGRRVWWTDGGVSRDQEYEKEPKLPQLCPLHQSGMTGLCKLLKYHGSGGAFPALWGLTLVIFSMNS